MYSAHNLTGMRVFADRDNLVQAPPNWTCQPSF